MAELRSQLPTRSLVPSRMLVPSTDRLQYPYGPKFPRADTASDRCWGNEGLACETSLHVHTSHHSSANNISQTDHGMWALLGRGIIGSVLNVTASSSLSYLHSATFGTARFRFTGMVLYCTIPPICQCYRQNESEKKRAYLS